MVLEESKNNRTPQSSESQERYLEGGSEIEEAEQFEYNFNSQSQSYT